MQRSTPNRKNSHKQFKKRVGKTERINLANPRRGGIRL